MLTKFNVYSCQCNWSSLADALHSTM